MGLTMSQRRAVTKTIATRYMRADKAAKGVVLDELCATTGWHRNHARKALAAALKPKIVKPARRARTPKYDAKPWWRCGSAGRCSVPRPGNAWPR